VTSSTYGSRVEAVLDVADADGMVAAAGALWVKTDDGRVVRIDPATNAVTDEIPVDLVSDPDRYCQGIGTDGTSVWACATRDDGTGVAQIDPGTRRVVRVVPADKVFDQLAIPATSRGMWLLVADGTEVAVVDPASGQLVSHPLGTRCLQLAARSDRVVATCATADRVLVLDATTGAVTDRATLHAPRVAAPDGADIWVDQADGLTRLTATLRVRTVYHGLVAGAGGDVFAARGSVWVRASGGTISRIDGASGRLVERIAPEGPLSGGSLVVAFGSIWTTAGDEGRVIRLRLDS
jgi:DNA-binding beta-propeller fold protein YncE